MVGDAVGKVCLGQKICPVILVIICTVLQVLFQNLIYFFRLAINLWMVNRGCMTVDPEQP